MFEVKVNVEVTAPDISAAITKLADAIGGVAVPILPETAEVLEAPKSEPVAAALQPEPIPMPAPVAPTAAAPVAPAAPIPAPAPVAPVAPVAPTAQATPQAPKIDMDALSRAGAGLINQGKVAEVMALLPKYNVQAVNLLDPSQYDAFAADLRALGAVI